MQLLFKSKPQAREELGKCRVSEVDAGIAIAVTLYNTSAWCVIVCVVSIPGG